VVLARELVEPRALLGSELERVPWRGGWGLRRGWSYSRQGNARDDEDATRVVHGTRLSLDASSRRTYIESPDAHDARQSAQEAGMLATQRRSTLSSLSLDGR